MKEFWLDSDRTYTNNELREKFKRISALQSFIVHYKGKKYYIPEGNGNVEKFIYRLNPSCDEKFTKESSSIIIPKLLPTSSDSTRLKYGSWFKNKFVSENDFDEFIHQELDSFRWHYLLTNDLCDEYTDNSFNAIATYIMCKGDRSEYEKKKKMHEVIEDSIIKEIIKKYKIQLKAYELKKGISDIAFISHIAPITDAIGCVMRKLMRVLN